MIGQDLKNSTIGIVGFGKIGFCLAKKLLAFEVKEILYCGHSEKPEAQEIGAKFIPFDELSKNSDFIFIICPLTPETKNMFNAEVFSKMKSNAVLINIARGEIVNVDDLCEALKSGKIFAAGLDVVLPEPISFPPADHPIVKLPNCVILPHIATSTVRI